MFSGHAFPPVSVCRIARDLSWELEPSEQFVKQELKALHGVTWKKKVSCVRVRGRQGRGGEREGETGEDTWHLLL